MSLCMMSMDCAACRWGAEGGWHYCEMVRMRCCLGSDGSRISVNGDNRELTEMMRWRDA